MSMTIFPFKGGLVGFKSCVEREEIREKISLLGVNADRSGEYLVICSWCKKIKYKEIYWIEAEDAIEKMGIFDKELLPELSHGICPICYANALKDL